MLLHLCVTPFRGDLVYRPADAGGVHLSPMLGTQVCVAQPLLRPTDALPQPGFVRDLLCWAHPLTAGWSWETREDPAQAWGRAGAPPRWHQEVQGACASFLAPAPEAAGSFFMGGGKPGGSLGATHAATPRRWLFFFPLGRRACPPRQ